MPNKGRRSKVRKMQRRRSEASDQGTKSAAKFPARKIITCCRLWTQNGPRPERQQDRIVGC